jgi:hypothetical protein
MGSPGFWLIVALVAFVLSIGLTAVSYRLAQAYTAVADRFRQQDAEDAATFGEPTREEVEAPWLDGDTEDTPFIDLDELIGEVEVDAASVCDDTCLFGDSAAYFDSPLPGMSG